MIYTKSLDLNINMDEPALDRFESKTVGEMGAYKLLSENHIQLELMLHEMYEFDEDAVQNFMQALEDPHEARLCLLRLVDRQYSDEQKLRMLKRMILGRNFVCSLIGRKGGGKTALCASIAESVHEAVPSMPIYWLDINPALAEAAPWIKQTTEWDEVEDGALVVVDEAAVQYFSRDAMRKESKDMSKLLFVSRHHDLRIIFNSQTVMGADVNIWRMSDCFLVKPWQMADIYEWKDKRTQLLVRYIISMMPRSICKTLYTDGQNWMQFATELPDWWSSAISKGYTRISSRAEACKRVQQWLNISPDMKHKAIQERLKTLGINLPMVEVQNMIYHPKDYLKRALKL